jgi:hypothetical protein
MTGFRDKTADIEAAVAAANMHWHEAMVAYTERRRRTAQEHSEDSMRFASLARRLTWVPAPRDESGEAAA